MDDSVRKALMAEQTKNRLLHELSHVVTELSDLDDKKAKLESKRRALIIKAFENDVNKTTLANITGLNRNTIQKVVEHAHYKQAFRNDALIPKEESETYLAEQPTHSPEEVKAAMEEYTRAIEAAKLSTSE